MTQFSWKSLPLRRLVALAVFAGAMAAISAPARAGKFPEPSIYPIAWQLDFKHGIPKRTVVGTNAYWYMTYTVTNNTREEQIWRPEFSMVTKDGKVVKSDHGVPAEVFDKIKATEGNRLLQSAAKVAGNLRQGETQAKDGVAIWPEPAARMGSFQIFVGGLSGEYVILKDDEGKPVEGPDKLPVILHKTLELDFSIYGDEFYPGRDEVHAGKESWVMR